MSLRFGILTVSDRSSRATPDLSGPALVEIINAHGWEAVGTAFLADELTALRDCLSAWADGAGWLLS